MKFNNLQKPVLMLVIRSLLFFVFQALIALVMLFKDIPDVWNASAVWWPLTIIFTNLVCLMLLIIFYKQENRRYWDVFRIERVSMKSDLLFMSAFLVFGGLLGYLPNILSATWLFGDPQTALDLLVHPLPAWAAISSVVLFPLLQGMVEIPMYMLYVMPRLEDGGMRPWMAVVLVSFWLSAQHIFAPFLLNGRFILYRLVMFLPFAILVALVLRARPRLMPYIAVIHVLMDMSVAILFLTVMY